MGEEFSIAFDIAVVAILAVFAFVGLKRGFAKVVLGLVATVAAYALAMALSGPIANAVYSSFIESAIDEQIDSAVNDKLNELDIGNIAGTDFEKVKINGILAGDFELDYAGTRKTAVDLSKLDLSETGITREDLNKLGITDDNDLSKLNAKTAEFSMDDVENYGLGKLAVAQYIAVNLIQQPALANFDSIADKVGEYLPGIMGNSSSDNKGVSALRTVALKMLESGFNFRDAVMNGVVKPNSILLIRTAAFAVIFLLVNLALRIITAVTKLVNKMPVIGKVNALFGFILGLAEGVIAVFVVCLAIRLVVSLTGANMILFNQTAVDATFLFKWFYNLDFLNFVK